MQLPDEIQQPSCPVCGVSPVSVDERQEFMICKECGHKENFNDFMEEYESKVADEVLDSISKSFEERFRGSKNIKVTRK